jgi:hypothetical protein
MLRRMKCGDIEQGLSKTRYISGVCLKETPCMLAGLVRSRDGSRDDTGTHFMNLPSPNVQSEVNVKTFILNICIHVCVLHCSIVLQILAGPCQIGLFVCLTLISTNSVHLILGYFEREIYTVFFDR